MNTPNSAIHETAALLHTNRLIEFAAGGGLLRAHASGGDGGFVIVFTFDRASREAAEHSELADVRERVGDGTLQEAFDGSLQRLRGGQEVVELL